MAFRVSWRDGGEPRFNTNSESPPHGFRVTVSWIPSHCHTNSESLRARASNPETRRDTGGFRFDQYVNT